MFKKIFSIVLCLFLLSINVNAEEVNSLKDLESNKTEEVKVENDEEKVEETENNEEEKANVDLEINSSVSEKIKIEVLKTCYLNKMYTDTVLPKTLENNNQEKNEEGNSLQVFSTVKTNNNNGKKYLNITDKKENNFISNIFIRILNNLEITNLYSINNSTTNCEDINDFISTNNGTYIDDYVYSTFNKDTDFVISSTIKQINEDEYKLEIYLWDILDHRMVAGQYYILNKYNLKRISNVVSDFIYTKTTGEAKGFFDSKILYISETGSAKKRVKNIKVMNFNGENDIKITNDKLLTLTPIFSRYNKNEIYYLQYRNKKAYLYRENLFNHTRSILKIGEGIVFSPNFNLIERNQLVLSMADEKGTNLFLLNNENNKYYKLTNDKFINTSPSFSPDGKSIAYVSDKTGVKKIYSMDLESGEITLLSKGSGSYDKPVWAPDEKLIAFIKIEKGKFKLGVMTPDGENERYLLEDYLIEGIRWSPNSRYIMYSKQTSAYGKGSIPKLYIIDILTNYEYKINTPEGEGASDPDWVMNE